MRFLFITFLLSGCSVLQDVKSDIHKDITGFKNEFARLYLKDKE